MGIINCRRQKRPLGALCWSSFVRPFLWVDLSVVFHLCIDSFCRWNSPVWEKPSPVLPVHTFARLNDNILPSLGDFPHRIWSTGTRLFQGRLCCLVLLWYLKGSCLAADGGSADGGSFSGASPHITPGRAPARQRAGCTPNHQRPAARTNIRG